MASNGELNQLTLTGRSSSHFTRVTRLFAAELGVEYSFRPVLDMLSTDPANYDRHPALKVPTLRAAEGAWFGSLNICRELSRRSRLGRRVVWPEQLEAPVAANAQELVLEAMSTEVALIMNKVGGGRDDGARQNKLRSGLQSTLAWLDQNVTSALSTLPQERDLSYFEVTLFCLITHLEFRELLPIAAYAALDDFRRRFAGRPSVEQTAYRFDA